MTTMMLLLLLMLAVLVAVAVRAVAVKLEEKGVGEEGENDHYCCCPLRAPPWCNAIVAVVLAVLAHLQIDGTTSEVADAVVACGDSYKTQAGVLDCENKKKRMTMRRIRRDKQLKTVVVMAKAVRLWYRKMVMMMQRQQHTTTDDEVGERDHH